MTTRPSLRTQEDEDDGIRVDLEIVEDDEDRTRRRKRRRRRAESGAVELSRWISLGFTNWTSMLMPGVCFFLLYIVCCALVGLAVGCLGGLLARALPIVGMILTVFVYLSIVVPWSAGMTLVSLQQLQGKRWSFGDFFGGSQWWLPIIGNYILIQIFYSILIFVPVLLMRLVLEHLHLPPVLIQAVLVSFEMLAYLLLYPLTWMFSWQLILDGNYGPFEAITEGTRMALPHYFKLVPLAALTLLFRTLGMLLCVIGFGAAWPLAVLIESTAYLRLTGRRVSEPNARID